jgi:hypothetical protein
MRQRTRGGFLATAGHTQEFKDANCINTSWAVNASYLGQSVGRYEVFNDVVTPKFESRRGKGEIIMNPMSKRVSECVIYPGSGYDVVNGPPAPYGCAATAVYPKYRMEGNAFPLFVHLAEGLPSPYNAALSPRLVISDVEVSKLVADTCTKCWASRSLADSNLFESVAEYRQTMRMFGDTFLRGRSTLLKYARNPLVGASSVYLMIRYGIMPLVRDVQSIVKGLAKPTGRVRKTTRSSGTLERSFVRNFSNSYGGIYTQGISRFDNDSVSVRAMSLDEYEATLAANVGFTDNGLFITPWELIPWSFVLDWLVNVGNYLQALAPAQGRKNLGSCYVIRRTSSSLWVPTGTTPVGTWNVNRPVSGGVLATLQQVSRNSALVPPTLLIKPDFRFSETTRALDALALVVQVVSRIANTTRR